MLNIATRTMQNIAGFPSVDNEFVQWTDPIPNACTGPVIFLHDSCSVTRECLAHMLEVTAPELTVVPIVNTDETRHQAPDLILMNIRDGCVADRDFARQLLSVRQGYDPAVPVVVLSHLEDPRLACEALHCLNVRAYLTTSLKPAILIAALRLVLAGGTYMPFELFAHWPAMSNQISLPDMSFPEGASVPEFTSRELDVLQLLQEAKPNKIIAHHLNISENTAKVHVRNIMKKLHATNRTQVALSSKQLRPLNLANA